MVRKDLAIGVLAAQVVHAAGESSPGNLPEGTYAIVLAVPDEGALKAVAARLQLAGVKFVADPRARQKQRAHGDWACTCKEGGATKIFVVASVVEVVPIRSRNSV